MTKAISTTLALFYFCFSAHAGEALYDRTYGTCMDNSGGVTVEMHDCIGNEHARQDARLNNAYKNLAAQLSANRKNELLAVQRLWIRYRDANCKFHGDPDGGTMAGINAASCGLEMTARRARELEGLAQYEAAR